ncbi:MAG: hypothetical protein ACOCQS_02705 [Bacillota bacterium]
MYKKIIFSILIISLVLVISGCEGDNNLIGLRRIEYEPERAVLYIYYFPTKAEASNYFEREGVEDYFLFEINQGSAEEFFQELDGESMGDNQKKLTFSEDSENSAIDKVVNLIDENNLLRIEGPN